MNEAELKQQICRYLQSLELPAGSQLPTETKLCMKFGVTRYQARKVMSELITEHGWVKIQGSGTYLPGGSRVNRPIEKVIVLVAPYSQNLPLQLMKAHSFAVEHGYELQLFGISHDSVEYENECLQLLLSRRIYALIIEPHPGNPESFPLIDQFVEQGTRVVLLNCPEEKIGQYRVFGFDYHRAGYMAMVDLMRQGVERILHMCRLDSIAWQHGQFRRGMEEAAQDFHFPLEHVAANLALDVRNFVWRWLPENFEFPLHSRCGYIDDNNPFEASYCHMLLQAAGITDSPVISVYTHGYAQPCRMLLFDSEARFFETVRILIESPLAALPAERNFKPELKMPSDMGNSVTSLVMGYF